MVCEQILTGRISGEITTLDIQNFAEGEDEDSTDKMTSNDEDDLPF